MKGFEIGSGFAAARMRGSEHNDAFEPGPAGAVRPRTNRSGGIQGGKVIGQTDDFGFQAVTDKVSVHDLHGTMLGLLGIDHEKLTYRFNGRDFRLTDVGGSVITPILA